MKRGFQISGTMSEGTQPKSSGLPRLPPWDLMATAAQLFEQQEHTHVMLKTYETFLSDLISDFNEMNTKKKAQKQCPAGRVFQYRVGSGRVLDKIPGSGSGSGRVGVSKNTIGYFRVSFFLSGISGYFGYFRVCRVFSGISGFTHIY